MLVSPLLPTIYEFQIITHCLMGVRAVWVQFNSALKLRTRGGGITIVVQPDPAQCYVRASKVRIQRDRLFGGFFLRRPAFAFGKEHSLIVINLADFEIGLGK